MKAQNLRTDRAFESAFRKSVGAVRIEDALEAARNGERLAGKVKLVQEIVATHHGYGRQIMTAQDRSEPIVTIRQHAMFLARELTGASFPQIALAFSKKDHSTVMHACEAMRDKLETSATLRRTDESLRQQITKQLEAL